MARYGNSITKTTGAAAAAIAGLLAGATRGVRVYEVSVSLTTAVAADIGLMRPGNTPGALSGGQVGAAEDPSSVAGLAYLGNTWATTQPTVSAPAMRRVGLPASIGAGLIWTFPQGIIVPINGTLQLWQFGAAAVGYVCNFAYDE